MAMKTGTNRAAVEVTTPKPKGVIIKKGVIHQKLNSTIPADLHKAFKLECLKQDREMGEVFEELIAEWLLKQGVKEI